MTVPTNLLSDVVSGVESGTSGWTAGSNTTLSHSTRFFLGARSLGMAATADGSVSATTASRVPVVAGTEYQAYAFFTHQLNQAAGRVATVRISWYAAAIGGSALSTSTSAGVTLTNDLSWVTPPPQITAVAPVGAAYASVTITVTGLTAGTVVAADVMTLGAPTAWPGTLMPYTAASCETGIGDWAAYQNATLDRVSSDSWEGFYSLRITATASGATRVQPTATVPVTPGQEYVALAMVKPGASTSFIVELRWYDAGGVFISATPVTWALTAGTWTRVTAIDVAPPGAVGARIGLRPTASAGGQTWLCDQMGLMPAPLLPGTLLRYNAQSMEVDASAWAAVTGCTVERSTILAVQGGASLRINPTGVGPEASVQLTNPVPVTPGQAYRCGFWLYHNTSSQDVNVDVIFTWYNALGTTLAEGTFRWVMGTAAGWYTPVGSDVAPAGAASLRVTVRVLDPGILDFYYLDEISLGAGGLGIVAEVITGAYGAAISMQGLTVGGHTHYGVWRMRDDGALTAVRGESGDMEAVPITGDLAVAADYEAPLGVPVRYLLRAFTGTDYLRSTSRPITLPEPSPTDIVVKDPTQPIRQATLTVATLPDWTRQARQGVHQISGRARPIVITDVRMSRTGTLSVVTATRDEIQRLWWLVEQGSTLLIQWPSTWGEDDTYVQVGDVSEAHVVQWADYADRTWTLALTEVDRPVGGLTGSAARTWADVSAGNLDWLHVLMRYASWLDVYTDEERP